MKRLSLVVFAVLLLVQWWVPFSMIRQHEQTLSQGELWQFRSALVDPYDPFRGRYVTINVEAGEGIAAEDFDHTQTAYVALERDEDGYARYGAVTNAPPESGAYLRADGTSYPAPDTRAVWIQFPLDRYYMNEHIAPEAERVYRDASRDEEREASLDVRIRDGHAVIEQLYIDGIPVEDYVRGSR